MLSAVGSAASQSVGFTYKKYNSVLEYYMASWTFHLTENGVSAMFGFPSYSLNSSNGSISGSGTTEYINWSNGATRYANIVGGVRRIRGTATQYQWEQHNSNVQTRYIRGSYIQDVVVPTQMYPTNDRHSDGYWYVLQ